MTRTALLGWALFTLSGVVYLALAIREGDLLAISAAVLWTAGCLVFISER